MTRQIDYQDRFEARWTAAVPALSAYITAAVRDYHETEDLLQRVAVVAFAKQDQFDPDRSTFLTWITGIARYEILRWKREAAREGEHFDERMLARLAESQQRLAGEMTELRVALHKCLNKADDRSRRLIELRYAGSMNMNQIAERTGSSPGAVRTALHRIRAALLRCIRGQLELDEGEL